MNCGSLHANKGSEQAEIQIPGLCASGSYWFKAGALLVDAFALKIQRMNIEGQTIILPSAQRAKAMTRIAIIGNAGGGKSTVSRNLRDILGLPLHAIDQLQWLPGWKAAPQEEFAEAHAKLLTSFQESGGPRQRLARKSHARRPA